MLSRNLKRLGAIGVVGVGLEAIHVTVHDEWDDYSYHLKKKFKNIFNIDFMADIKPNYNGKEEVKRLPKVSIDFEFIYLKISVQLCDYVPTSRRHSCPLLLSSFSSCYQLLFFDKMIVILGLHVYVCNNVYAYLYMCPCICMYMNKDVVTHICIYVYYICMYACIHIFMHEQICTYMNICLYVYVYIYIYVFAYICACT